MFGEKKTKNNMINIHINNSQICQKDEVKYLGIVIDKNLKWKPHIDKLTTQISQSVGMLYHLKKYLSFNNLKLVYHALIKSRLQYGIVRGEMQINQHYNTLIKCIIELYDTLVCNHIERH